MLGCTQGHTISGTNQRVTCHSQTQDPSEFCFVSLKVNTRAEKSTWAFMSNTNVSGRVKDRKAMKMTQLSNR